MGMKDSVYSTPKGRAGFATANLPRRATPEQHKSLFETGFDLNEAVSQAMKANSTAINAQDMNLVFANCLVRQHKAITNVPIVSSLADPQSWRERVIISNIAQMPNTSQASPAELRKTLEQHCNRLLPGSVTDISVADIASRTSQGIAVFDVKLSMNLDLVPKFLIWHDSKDS